MATSGFLDTFDALGATLGGSGDAVLTLRLDQIDEDPNNPRRVFDDGELDALAQTLTRAGVLQPIVVQPPDARGRYRLRFGARRLRAAQRLGWIEIPAVVRPAEADAANALLEQLIENDQREGLSTAELARAVDQLLASGLSQAEVSQRLGRTKPQIAMLAAVKGMAPELQALAHKLGARTLYELHAAWKASPDRTRKFLKGRRPDTITQVEARDLAGRPSARVIRDPADGSTRNAAQPGNVRRPTPIPSAAALSAPPASTMATFEVTTGDLKGVLVLDNVPAPSRRVLIRTADGSLHRVSAAEIKIVRVTPG